MKTDSLLSIVVPVYNGGAQLERCLDALRASDYLDYEIVVVDDGSTDGSAAVARVHGAQVVRLNSRRGPAAARNRGARQALGGNILFVDADVVVRRDTLARVAAIFSERPGVAAVFGSYDDAPAALNFISQYKNLLHHFMHQQASADAETFWAGCGAVRRKAFESVGGFDETKYTAPSIEDIELGYRLRRAGFTILLDGELQVTHLKRWTFFSLVRTDIFARALPWSRLIVEDDGLINDLNLRVTDRVSAALCGLSLSLLILSFFHAAFLAGMLAALAGVFLLNLRFYRFLKERRGRWFAAMSFAMLGFYYFYSGTVFLLFYCAHTLRNAGRGTRPGRRAAESGRINDA